MRCSDSPDSDCDSEIATTTVPLLGDANGSLIHRGRGRDEGGIRRDGVRGLKYSTDRPRASGRGQAQGLHSSPLTIDFGRQSSTEGNKMNQNRRTEDEDPQIYAPGSIGSGDPGPTCTSSLLSPLRCIYRLFIPSRIFLKFLIAALIPALADQIIPLFFTGQIPDQSALSISSQYIFISIIIEVIQEGIVNSIFFYIGQNYKDHRVLALQGLKICLVLVFLLGSLLTAFILIFSKQFVSFIDTPSNITDATQFFLWTSAFSFPLTLTSAVLSNYLYVTTHWLLIVAQFSQVCCSLFINMALFGHQSSSAGSSLPSLRWGVHELGYYKIIAAGVNFTINLVFLHIVERMNPIYFLRTVPFLHDIKSNFKTLFKVSWGNFGDSAVRNFFYFMVTLKFINRLGETESGAWGLLNSLIWSLLLIPSYTTANYIKVRIGHVVQNQDLKLRMKKVAKVAFMSLTAWLAVLALVSGLWWPSMAEWFSQSNEKIQDMSASMFYQVGWIFIVFSYNNAMDSLFFGTGRTEYIFYQSVGTNMIVYFVPWILYLSNVLEPTLWWVLGLYIAGMLVDFCLTALFCCQLWKQIPESGCQSPASRRVSYRGESQEKLEEAEDDVSATIGAARVTHH